MMEHNGSLNTEEWKIIARKDWDRVKLHLSVGDAEAAGFFLQQSLEKYLKAFLLQRGWQLKKIHALHDLLNDAVIYDPKLEDFRKLCERISGYYLLDRYPPIIPSGLTCKDIRRDAKEAKKFVRILSDESL